MNPYTWDRANRLLSFGGASYKYDGLGQRVSQTVSSIVTKYLLDTQPGLAVVLKATTGSDDTYFIHGPRGLERQQQPNGDWVFPVPDGLGSIRGVVDNNWPELSMLESRLYTPYGVPFGVEGSQQTVYGFTGEPTDANALVYLRARYLNPGLGVFASLDPAEGHIRQAMSLNLYSWVEGDVTNSIDPSGQLPLPLESSGGCFTYVRPAATSYAIVYAGEANYPPVFIDLTKWGENYSNCANLVSQALLAGQHPMAFTGGAEQLKHVLEHGLINTDPRTSTDWACSRWSQSGVQCTPTRTWREADLLAKYLFDKSNVDASSAFDINTDDKELVNNKITELIYGQDGVVSKGIGIGDVLAIDSRPPHIAMVIGWGARVGEGESPSVVLRLSPADGDVPYIVDNNNKRPRPFYFLGFVHTVSNWRFVKVPSVTCVPEAETVPVPSSTVISTLWSVWEFLGLKC